MPETAVLSIVLATSRPSYGAMPWLPDVVDHLAYTFDSLGLQEGAPTFEVVIADALHNTRMRTPPGLRVASLVKAPVYHVPVTSPWFDRTPPLPAISRSRNVGIAHAAGVHVVFVDDCSWLPPNALAKYWEWFRKGWFLNALHVRKRGDEVSTRDARFDLFHGGKYWHYNDFGLNGYMSASMEALLKVNGFDEAFDGSRQLEDGDLGLRLRAAGYRLVLDPKVVVEEQEHAGAVGPSGESYGRCTRCNGVWTFLHRMAGNSRVRANTRDWRPSERAMASPCGFLRGTMCTEVGAECNMWVDRVGGRHTHESLPARFTEAPVFDLARMRDECLPHRERYRVG